MSGSLFDESKIIIINRASDKLLHTIEDLIERKIEDTIFIFNCEILEKSPRSEIYLKNPKINLFLLLFILITTKLYPNWHNHLLEVKKFHYQMKV